MDINLLSQVRANIESDLDQRRRAHQALIAKTTSMRANMIETIGPGPSLNLLAQGDSWFDYPLPFPRHTDIIAHLDGVPLSPIVYNLAHYGEAVEDMLGTTKLQRFLDALANPANGKFDGILFSGGGNDLAGDQFRLWINDASAVGAKPENALFQSRVEDVLGIIEAGYLDLFKARDSIDRKIPVFAHAYDFAIPNNVGAPCGIGPWLHPSLMNRGWGNLADGTAIVRALLLQFDALLAKLASDPVNNFFRVPTQNTLAAGDWTNELHPNEGGFSKMAAKFVQSLRAVFPGRI